MPRYVCCAEYGCVSHVHRQWPQGRGSGGVGEPSLPAPVWSEHLKYGPRLPTSPAWGSVVLEPGVPR